MPTKTQRKKKEKHIPAVPLSGAEIYCTIADFGEYVYRAGLYPRIASRSTVRRWMREGYVIVTLGALGTKLVHVKESLTRLKYPIIQSIEKEQSAQQ